MSKFLSNLKKYTRDIFWFFSFLITGVLLFLIMPGEQKFKYEYQKGFPWNHENLVAPFDFAILKTSGEIETEKEEMLQSVLPYFIFEPAVAEENIVLLAADLELMPDSTETAFSVIFEVLKNELSGIYSAGIFSRSARNFAEDSEKNEIKKRTGNVVSKIETDKVFSEKTAYNQFNTKIKELAGRFSEQSEFLLRLKAEKYILPNLEYDESTTQKETDDIVRNISSTRGMVQTGERIILQGEIVNDEKFQILESLKSSYKSEQGEGINKYVISIGKGTLIVVFMVLLFTYLHIYRFDILNEFRKLSFLLLFLVSMIFLALLFNSFPSLHIYMVPFAIFPIVVRTFYDSRTSIFTLLLAAILTGFYAPNNFEFVFLQVTAGVVAVFSLNRMHRRCHLVMAAVWVLITYSLVYISLEAIYEGSFLTIDYKTMRWFVFSSVLILLVYPLIFIFEKLFGFVSDVTLIELSDTNQPVLRQLAEQAPGTFQHSMQIANLAEEIILRIGGNPFLVRAGALYHDIGKIERPGFFIENQAVGINPHDKMDYLESAEIIIDHVRNGVKLAKKHNLPDAIVEFVATHHGTTKAQYFYLKYQEENPGIKVDEQLFIYPGPLPRTKEAAVVMIVDGIEAASRSLKEKTVDNLKELIQKMVDHKIRERQLRESDLTFRDITIIKETLLEKLVNIYHVRIEYPKEKDEQNNQVK